MSLKEFFVTFSGMFIADVFWALYIKSVKNELALRAGIFAVLLYLAGAISVLNYVKNSWDLIPACLGSFLGTIFVMKAFK